MKFLLLFSFVVLAFSLFGCSFWDNEIQYSFSPGSKETKEDIQTAEPDTMLIPSLSIRTRELITNKNEPVDIYYYFSENTPHVKKLQAINIALFSKDEKGVFTELQGNSSIDIEYYNGKNSIKSTFKDNKEPINKLIDWKDVNYSYEFLNVTYLKDKNSITYSGNHSFKMKNYPDTLKLVATLKWEGEEKIIERIMNKEKYTGRKFNPKF